MSRDQSDSTLEFTRVSKLLILCVNFFVFIPSSINDTTLQTSASTNTIKPNSTDDSGNSKHGNILILGSENSGKFSLAQMLSNKSIQKGKENYGGYWTFDFVGS